MPFAFLSHVSQTPGIPVFHPQEDARGRRCVWAIGENRLHNYLLPRDCPRVTFYAADTTTAADVRRFLAGGAHSVVAIERNWLERCRNTTLYIYQLDPAGFVLEDPIASYYVSEESVSPVSMIEVHNPLEALLDRGVELRVLPTLWYLREAVAASTLGFSIIRMRNAGAKPEGFVSEYPVVGRSDEEATGGR